VRWRCGSAHCRWSSRRTIQTLASEGVPGPLLVGPLGIESTRLAEACCACSRSPSGRRSGCRRACARKPEGKHPRRRTNRPRRANLRRSRSFSNSCAGPRVRRSLRSPRPPTGRTIRSGLHQRNAEQEDGMRIRGARQNLSLFSSSRQASMPSARYSVFTPCSSIDVRAAWYVALGRRVVIPKVAERLP
jgi:hypothetical protein